MTTVLVMSEPEKLVPLQFPVRKSVRKRLKSVANDRDTTMALLGDALLDYGLSLLESGNRFPPALAALVEKAAEQHSKNKEATKGSDSPDSDAD